MTGGTAQAFWAEDGRSFKYRHDGKWLRFDVATATSTPTEAPDSTSRPVRGRAPSRGRQNATVTSPDGKRTAESRDRNVVGGGIAITTDGSGATRVK